jgi:hypothetical protein
MSVDALLRLADKPRRVEKVTRGDLTFCVRGLHAGDFDRITEAVLKDDSYSSRVHVVATALCGEDGTPAFGEPEKVLEKIERLPEVLFRELLQAAEMASDLKPGEAGELLGNFGARTVDSPAASQATSTNAA